MASHSPSISSDVVPSSVPAPAPPNNTADFEPSPAPVGESSARGGDDASGSRGPTPASRSRTPGRRTPGGSHASLTPRSDAVSSPLDFGSERPPVSGSPARGTPSRTTRSGLGTNTSEPDREQTVIWGTTINVSQYIDDFKTFLTTFSAEGGAEAGAEEGSLYERYLQRILHADEGSLNLDCAHVRAHSAPLYRQLVQYPQEVVPLMDIALADVLAQVAERTGVEPSRRVLVRPYNLEAKTPMRALDPCHIDTLVAVHGMVTRTSSIVPDLKHAWYECALCGAGVTVVIDHGQINEPRGCASCSATACMQIVHNRCTFADKQVVRLQEAPDNIPEGETPQTITALCWDDLVDVAKPGDRVVLTGVFRAQPIRVNPRQRTLKAVYRTYFDLMHVCKLEAGRLRAEDATAAPLSEWHTPFDETGADEEGARAARKEAAEAIAGRGDVYDALARALAPSIWELDDVKKGVLCQLFAGSAKSLDAQSAGGARFRGDLNVLLVGDPGTSKSQLLQYVHKAAPRGIYTSGKGSSAVGLTAYVTRDQETGGFVLESGALVLSDRGVCCIDEFDKMSDGARSVLHEVMEQQTVSIAKAGIICSLNARTSVLASANPRESRYNPSLSVIDNIDLSPSLLSRFDLIYLLLDKPDERTDRQLARHLVALYGPATRGGAGASDPASLGVEGTPIDQRALTDYISYARQHCHPRVTDDAAERLVAEYVEMRRVGASRKTISATPRQLESLIRLAEAHARLHLREDVGEDDVGEAVRLMRVATQQAATDPHTGTIDMDLIATGRSAAARGALEQLASALLEQLRSTPNGSASLSALQQAIADATSIDASAPQLREALDQLKAEHAVIERGATISLVG